jgi:hypothetical protein
LDLKVSILLVLTRFLWENGPIRGCSHILFISEKYMSSKSVSDAEQPERQHVLQRAGYAIKRRDYEALSNTTVEIVCLQSHFSYLRQSLVVCADHLMKSPVRYRLAVLIFRQMAFTTTGREKTQVLDRILNNAPKLIDPYERMCAYGVVLRQAVYKSRQSKEANARFLMIQENVAATQSGMPDSQKVMQLKELSIKDRTTHENSLHQIWSQREDAAQEGKQKISEMDIPSEVEARSFVRDFGIDRITVFKRCVFKLTGYTFN